MFDWLNNILYSDKNQRISNLQAELSKELTKNYELQITYDKLRETNLNLNARMVKMSGEIDLLNQEINKLQQAKTQNLPKTYGTISLPDVNILLAKQGITDINLSDENFNLTSMTEAKKFTEETKVQYRQWQKEDHDCDNFSFAAMGYWSEGLISFAFGIAWSKTHAFNLMVDKDKVLWVCEPQTNVWTKYSEIRSNSQYKIISVMM